MYQTGNTGWKEATACIESIFSPSGLTEYKDPQLYDRIQVFPHFLKYQSKSAHYPNSPKRHSRRNIISFTRKARSRMIQLMGSLFEYPDFWQTFTFPDDTMKNLTVTQKAELSAKVLKRFKRKLQRQFKGQIKLNGIWRRDWEHRKSGLLVGALCPHFHIMFFNKYIVQGKLDFFCKQIARTWVDCINTEQKEKALAVATNKHSYEELNNNGKAQKYIVKYMGKLNELDSTGDSLGRFWGKIGNIQTVEGVEFCISDEEAVILKRIFRSKIGKKAKSLLKVFRAKNKNGWILLNYQSFIKIMELIKEQNYKSINKKEIQKC